MTIDEIKSKDERSIAIGPFGSRMKAELYVDSGIPVIRGNNISNTRELTGGFVFVSTKTADELRSCNVFADDLVFPHRGAIGQVAIVPRIDTERFMLSTSLMKLTCDKNLVDPKFVFYFFRSSLGRHALLRNSSTVGTPGIGQPLSSLRSIEIPVPPIEEQQAIAHILGTLDDKIDLNRRMNQTLEEIARAIFKSWFIDFDPVRAKAEGRQPFGIDAETAALFPDSFEESELGMIPAGWTVSKFLQHAVLLSGGTPKTDRPEYWGGDIQWASAKDVSQCAEGFLISTDRTITDLGLAESSTKMIPQYATAVVARGATTGRMTMLGSEMAMNQTCYALQSTTATPFWLNLMAQSEIGRLLNAAHGSVFDTITTSTFNSSQVIAPSIQVKQQFETLINHTFRKILANLRENETLKRIRDALLPQLLSGELRVSVADRKLSEVGV